jgi:hypothetical protein
MQHPIGVQKGDAIKKLSHQALGLCYAEGPANGRMGTASN